MSSVGELRSALAAAMIATVGVVPTANAAAALVPPPGYLQPVTLKKPKEFVCAPTPTPFTGVLDFKSKYEGADSARDQVNEQAAAEHDAQTAEISALEKGVASTVDKYMDSGNPAQLACVLDWLDAWAGAKALEGEARNHQGKSVRKWTLASLSSAWLRLKFSSTAPLRDQAARAARIEAWFNRLADQVMLEWLPDDPVERINNHYYWAAWALMSCSVVSGRRELFDRAVALYRVFETQVDADGDLPNELRRRTRALGYQAYALAPLAMIAAFGKANGVDLADEGDHALARLARRVAAGVADPGAMAAKAGAAQDMTALSAKGFWVWLEPYCASTACDAALSARLKSRRPVHSTRLGGNLSAVFAGAQA